MKKIKSIWIRLLIVVLSVAMMVGCLGTITFAEGDSAESDALHDSGKIVSKVALDESFTILKAKSDVEVTVKDPTGKNITNTSADNLSYSAAILGNYTVTYARKNDDKVDTSYTYNINCYVEDTYYIFVANNGADIPTIMGSGDSFKLPEWYLAKDVNGKMVILDNDNNVVINYKATLTVDNDGKTESTVLTQKPGENVTVSNAGNKILTLSANIGNSKKTYSKEFTIISQGTFEDDVAPTIRNIANMPSTASTNTAVTLPVATAEDNYDDNVLVNITVKDPDNNNVKDVEVNDQDYAVKELESDRKFDNDKNMTFYPTKAGAYTVTYSATDDEGNVSAEHVYRINVSDRTGPVIVDTQDDRVPSTWGLTSVQNGNEDNDELTGEGLSIYIPIPDVVDNLDKFTLNEASDAFTGNVTMTVELANSSTTVAKTEALTPAMIKEAFDSNSGSTTKYAIDYTNSTYGKYFKENATGLVIVNKDEVPCVRINFSDFSDDDSNDKVKAAVTGNWTVTFSFRDAANNGGYNKSQKVYTINVTDSAYIDEEAPKIEAPSLPDYLIVGNDDTTYTVPDIIVSDNRDTNLTEEYSLYSGNDTTKTLDVEGGEVLQIVSIDGGANTLPSYYFVKSEDELSGTLTASEESNQTYITAGSDKYEALLIGDTLSFAFKAIDDAGNEAELKNTVKGTDDTDTEVDYSLNVYKAEDVLSSDIDDNITFNFTEEEISAGTADTQYVGSFKVNDIKQREFIGFELTVKDEKGNLLDDVTSYVYYSTTTEGETTTESLNVEAINFNPASAGDYEIDIRIFDANNNTYVVTKKVTAKVTNPGTTTVPSTGAATSWANEGSTRKSYMLQRKPFTAQNPEGSEDNEYTRVYKIYGGRFSLLGYEFTPMVQGGYTITEYYIQNSQLNDDGDSDYGAGFVNKIKNNRNAIYGMTVTDASSTKFEIDGEIPSYLDKTNTPKNKNKYESGAFYVTDSIIAYSDVLNYDLTVNYTDPKGNSFKAEKAYEKLEGATDENRYVFKETEGYEFNGKYALILDKDGTYTVTIKANDSSSSPSTKTYTIKVGDIVAPQFSLTSNLRDTSKKVGDSFSYRLINKSSVTDTDNIKVYYKLFEPGSSSEVSSVSGSMTYTKYLSEVENKSEFTPDSDYKFEKSGDYTVEITLEDAAGNKSVQKYTISVSTTTSKTPRSLTMLSTVLIIVGVLLIVGVVIYLIRFRKRKA